MEITKRLGDEAVLEELGRRLARQRLGLQLTQAEAAERAGVSKRTLERLEAGAPVQLASLIRVLRVLDLLDGLERLLPAAGPRPLDLLRFQGRERKRASPAARKRDSAGWRWGEDE